MIYSKMPLPIMNEDKLIKFMIIGLLIGLIFGFIGYMFTAGNNIKIMFILSLPEGGLVMGLLYGAVLFDRESHPVKK